LYDDNGLKIKKGDVKDVKKKRESLVRELKKNVSYKL
jgi:hypothetical protein